MTITRLPDLVRFLAIHAAIGFAVAAVFVAGLIELNPSDIGTLLAHADDYPMPTVILWFLLGLTSSSCQMGAAVMLLGNEPRDDGRRRVVAGLLAPMRLPKRR